jgi:isocitrate dehydrogenase
MISRILITTRTSSTALQSRTRVVSSSNNNNGCRRIRTAAELSSLSANNCSTNFRSNIRFASALSTTAATVPGIRINNQWQSQQSSNITTTINSNGLCAAKRMMMSTTTTTTTTATLGTEARMPVDGTTKVLAPPMVYIAGEEMTRYACELVLDQWIRPYFDVSQWEYYDLSCTHRDATNDQVLKDAVKAGARIGAIFKEPTITPSTIQCKEMGLKNALGSPNGAMRRGWNGITISRDTIHIDGIELGYKNPVLFERHAVGGEYGAGWKAVGAGTLLTNYIPDDPNIPPSVVDKRDLTDDHNVVVVYHNPYDNVAPLAHFFFNRCYDMKVTPYIVTKKTVFKWQEGFWQVMKEIFDKEYKSKFLEAGLLQKSNNELTHLISDAATMQLIRWTDGGFGMAAHNYDGDMCTYKIIM